MKNYCVIHNLYRVLAPNLTQINFVRLVRMYPLTKIHTFVTTDAIIENKETWFGNYHAVFVVAWPSFVADHQPRDHPRLSGFHECSDIT